MLHNAHRGSQRRFLTVALMILLVTTAYFASSCRSQNQSDRCMLWKVSDATVAKQETTVTIVNATTTKDTTTTTTTITKTTLDESSSPAVNNSTAITTNESAEDDKVLQPSATFDTHASLITAKKVLNKTADGIPRMYISSCCSGSTAAGTVLRRLLWAHGFQLYNTRRYEFFKPHKNFYYQAARDKLMATNNKEPTPEEAVFEAIKMANEEAKERNEFLIFKINLNQMYLTDRLRSEMNGRFTQMVRENTLDSTICKVRDCFNTNHGHPVFENGTRTDLCFARRSHPENKVMAHLYKKTINRALSNLSQKNARWESVYRELIKPSKVQSSEDLFAFEYTDDESTFQSSISAWVAFLTPLFTQEDGQVVDRDVIISELLPMRNSRSPPPPHRETIHNFDGIERTLRLDGSGFDKLIRY